MRFNARCIRSRAADTPTAPSDSGQRPERTKIKDQRLILRVQRSHLVFVLQREERAGAEAEEGQLDLEEVKDQRSVRPQ